LPVQREDERRLDEKEVAEKRGERQGEEAWGAPAESKTEGHRCAEEDERRERKQKIAERHE
jgi:hypothetical protein